MLPLMFVGAGAGGGTLIDQSAVADTYLDGPGGDEEGNQGSDIALFVDNSGVRRNTLIKFDLSSLAGKTITSVVLSLWASTTQPNPGTFKIHRILAANALWGEMTATWSREDWDADNPWAGDVGSDGGADAGCSVSGTDYSATEMGSFTTSGQVANTEMQVTLNATEFTAMIGANYGMIVIPSTANLFTFRSRNYSTATRRPKLTVSYTG